VYVETRRAIEHEEDSLVCGSGVQCTDEEEGHKEIVLHQDRVDHLMA